METFRLRLIMSVLFFFLVASCTQEIVSTEEQYGSSDRMARVAVSDEEATALKKEFGVALAKSLKESPMLRALLKVKALEMFDEDYDVLYQLVKSERLESGVTVRELLTKQLKNRGRMQVIETKLPTLTVFVPDLPMGSFSAQSWNTEQQIPLVGIKLTRTNDVPILDAEGREQLLPAKYAPGFPVVVVKEALRVVDSSNPNFHKRTNIRTIPTTDGLSFRFIDEAFDRSLNKKKNGRLVFASQLDQKVKDAYEIFLNTDNWHRDHIYYDLTTTVDKGEFKYTHQEALTSFRMREDDVMGGYNLISDQSDDPRVRPSESTDQVTFWTSSSYSFRMKVLLNAKNGIGTEVIKNFPVAASSLYDVQYQEVKFGSWPFRWSVYFPSGLTPKTVSVREVIFPWDLNQYATTIKVTIEEVDVQTTTTRTESASSTFAANFGIDGGVLKKIGLKLGASSSTTNTVTLTQTYTQGNDELGSTVISFADNVVTNRTIFPFIEPLYTTREYDCGYCRISVEPVRVQ